MHSDHRFDSGHLITFNESVFNNVLSLIAAQVTVLSVHQDVPWQKSLGMYTHDGCFLTGTPYLVALDE